MDQLKPSDFTILQQSAELLDLCAGTEERRAEIARKMEAISLHMDRLRSAVASLPGIAISQLDQKKVLAECQQDLEKSLAELAEYGQVAPSPPTTS
ncbi:hypothetical protein H4R20_003350 [Coemansia guatemalensis]|uniref:Mediator of RNA polymerase II transcription subunit 9 n=1 Tax=Coemansia guatemalensis TaxID=2761395 RepID=A0A9W8I0S2_9FUNG|nr:hypothetical protein H4R20_003350 [Coemansia guatemalensis]